MKLDIVTPWLTPQVADMKGVTACFYVDTVVDSVNMSL